MSEMGLNIEPISLIREHDLEPTGRNRIMVGPNDSLVAEDLNGSNWYSKATRLGELGDATDASVASMWDRRCEEITVYVLGKEHGETIACEFHTITLTKPGVVSGQSGPANLLAITDADEGLRTQSRPGYLATLEDLRPPVIE